MIDHMLAYVIMQQSEFGRRESRRRDWTLNDEHPPTAAPRFRRWRLWRGGTAR